MSSLVGQHQVTTFTSPVNGTTPIDANTVRGNDNTLKTAYDAHDSDTTIHLQDSTLAARPVASTVGQKWFTNDGYRLYYDDGAAWHEAAYLPTAGGTVSGNLVVTGTLGVTGVATFTAQPILSSLTASQAVFTDGSKGLVSNAITGTGNVVMSASPTLTGTAALAGATFSTSVISTTALATPSALSATQFTAFASTVSGATLMGYGTTGDVTLKNRAGTDALIIGPNNINVALPGTVTIATLTVSGTTNLQGDAFVLGALGVSLTLGVTGNFSVNTSKFTVAASSGNTVVGGTLAVTGAVTLSSTLGVAGAGTFNTYFELREFGTPGSAIDGWKLYTESGTKILKAINSAGTVRTLASP